VTYRNIIKINCVAFINANKAIETVTNKQQLSQEDKASVNMTQYQSKLHILIAAAGSGTRMKTDTPKQYLKINGKTILRHTIDAFLTHPETASIQVIIDPNHIEKYQESVKDLNLPPCINGSKSRKKSIHNGLKALAHLKNKDIVLIHDAARPLISAKDISAIAAKAAHSGAATLAYPLTDTLKRGTINITDDVERTNIWAIQTPQAFHYDLINTAHNTVKIEDATDDTTLVQALGHKVSLIQGAKTNIKITTPDDLEMVKIIMNAQTQYETRTGQGFDVHAFHTEKNKDGQIRLCGINIPHPYKLKGHSDADVGLHALTDAILGAIAQGDIGTHFPPSNNTYKNMDSAIFLEHATKLANTQGAKIINLDLTLICEAPKIAPYSTKMIKRIAEITHLADHRISVKATTSERLGFTGRGEGIAATAIATIQTPVKI